MIIWKWVDVDVKKKNWIRHLQNLRPQYGKKIIRLWWLIPAEIILRLNVYLSTLVNKTVCSQADLHNLHTWWTVDRVPSIFQRFWTKYNVHKSHNSSGLAWYLKFAILVVKVIWSQMGWTCLAALLCLH